MERKLTLTDICGYIPHGLCKVNDLYRNKIKIVNTLNNGVNDLIYRSDLYKPILRPQSDLYRPITHKGMEVIPIWELAKIECNEDDIKQYELEKNHLTMVFENGEQAKFKLYYGGFLFNSISLPNTTYPVFCQSQLFDFLHELKVDYRGLIDAKLCISCYDLDTNPYN